MHRIIHHTDADGHASAAVVYYALVYNKNVDRNDICFIPINYGMELFEGRFDYDKDFFYMVDYALQPLNVMAEFVSKMTRPDQFIWIDHHRTALMMEEEEPGLKDVLGIREEGKAGCELCWEYYFTEKMPELIRLLGRYDIWDQTNMSEWDDKLVPLQMFLKASDHSPSKNIDYWEEHIEDALKDPDMEAFGLAEEIAEGRHYQKYQENQDTRTLKSRGFHGTFAGHKAFFVNYMGNSQMFEKNCRDLDVDLFVTFVYSKGHYWTIGVYTFEDKGIHCGELCKKLGEAGPRPSGGGHPGAAGFQCDWDYFWSLIETK
jgi:oligoribonuclease NrnB/cAMP/cGMP phosphodiesterase (DHH superfamily)